MLRVGIQLGDKLKYFGFYVLSLNPMVLSCIGKPALLPTWANGCVLLEHAAWYQGYWLKMIQQRQRQKQFATQKIEHHLIVNTDEEHFKAKVFGVRATFASQQLYCNERIFKPAEVERVFDAIYIAKLERFKRQELAVEIRNLER